jgi:ATP-binding cassette subfamily C protein LapB
LAVRAAERSGFSARIVHRDTLSEISDLSLPCILLLRGGHAVVFVRREDGQAIIAQPESDGGTQSVPMDQLEAEYTGNAIFVRPKLALDKGAKHKAMAEAGGHWFWGTLKKFAPIYSHVMIASFLVNCFALASPLFVMNVYDRVIPNNAQETLWVLALGVTIVFLFEFLIRNLRSYFVDIAGRNADTIIASRLMERVMGMKMDEKPASTGALASNMREYETVRDFITSGTVTVLIDLPFIFLFLGVIWLLAGNIALIPMAAVPVVIAVGVALQYPLSRIMGRSHAENQHKHSVLVEAISGLETIKTTGAESGVQGKWEQSVGEAADTQRKSRLISSIATSFSQLSVQLVTVIVIIAGVYQIAEGELTMGGLIACSILTGRALAPLGGIAALISRYQHTKISYQSLAEIMATPTERSAYKAYHTVNRLDGHIEFRKVSFSYPEQQGDAVDQASFEIRPGEKVGILGRIGSGKTTIGRLLTGLYEPQSGAVLIDHIDIRQMDPADLRRNIGYVSQDNFLFKGTVRENIAFGAPHMDEAAIDRAAQISGVNDFLKQHPHGLDLQVGERGLNLSGGQRQSIVIARALMLDPSILLLDEPTSNMDTASETRFIKRIGNFLGDRTVVLNTHRTSLLRLVDRLIVIDHGRIVANGDKEQVMESLKSGKVNKAPRNA